MARRVSPTLVGAFVLGAVALAAGAVLVLGGREWFKRPVTCVMAFDGSVAGLTPDAPVSFRGVQVGKVASIELRPGTALIVVVAHIDPSQVRGLPMPVAPAGAEHFIQEAVRKGVRAQLQLQSFITGQLYVGLDYYPGTPVRLTGIDKSQCEIPTIPTAIAQMQDRIRRILDELEHVPVKEAVEAATRTLDAVEKLATAPDIRRILADLDAATRDTRVLVGNLNAKVDPTVTSLQRTLAQAERTIDEVGRDVRRLVQDIDARIAPLAADLGATSESTRALVQDARRSLHDLDDRLGPAVVAFRDAADAARDAMRAAESAVGQVNGVLDANSPLGYQLADALEQLTRTARALRALGEEIHRQPNVLLFGRGKAKEE